MSHGLFIGARGMLKRKPPGYYEKIAQLREELGERAARVNPAPVGLSRSEVRLARPLTQALDPPWWVR